MMLDLMANFINQILVFCDLMKNNEKMSGFFSHIVKFQCHRNVSRSSVIQEYFCPGLALTEGGVHVVCATTGT